MKLESLSMELWARESLLCQVVRCLCWSDQRALGDYRQCVRKCDLRLPELIYRREMELRYWRVDVHIPRSNLETIAAERLKQARLTWGSERAFEEGSGAKHLHTAEERRHDVQLPAVTCPENAREQLQKSRRGTESVCSGQRGVVVGDTSRAASDFGLGSVELHREGANRTTPDWESATSLLLGTLSTKLSSQLSHDLCLHAHNLHPLPRLVAGRANLLDLSHLLRLTPPATATHTSCNHV